MQWSYCAVCRYVWLPHSVCTVPLATQKLYYHLNLLGVWRGQTRTEATWRSFSNPLTLNKRTKPNFYPCINNMLSPEPSLNHQTSIWSCADQRKSRNDPDHSAVSVFSFPLLYSNRVKPDKNISRRFIKCQWKTLNERIPHFFCPATYTFTAAKGK